MPESFRASVLAQLGALPDLTRHAPGVAAVLGDSFPPADLATVLDRRADSRTSTRSLGRIASARTPES